ncbi:transposase [Streptomyces sp. NPDC091292]|uniref:transposase n=1 Tax=Streptomyces sp. NPDC091292 TaxID=3365991 RepID=UPI003801D8FE
MIDSQSVKSDAVVGSDSRGFDGGKLINGRKRHVVVDTLGLLPGVMVTAADTGDRAAAQVLLGQVADAHHRLALVWADGGYTGNLVEHCLAAFALVLAIVKRSNDMHGFVVLPKRRMDGAARRGPVRGGGPFRPARSRPAAGRTRVPRPGGLRRLAGRTAAGRSDGCPRSAAQPAQGRRRGGRGGEGAGAAGGGRRSADRHLVP